MALFDLPKLKEEIAQIEKKQEDPAFWDDHREAASLSNRLGDLKNTVKSMESINSDFNDLSELLKEATPEDIELCELIETLEKDLDKKIHELRTILLFSGEYDELNATIEIHPGAGGTEAMDWAEMLLRMYNRWAESHRFKWEVLYYEPGEEAGCKSATVKVSGTRAYGMLKSEKGVHRLVRISPFDANARRHTSFASVSIVPEFKEVDSIVIDQKDLKVDTYRSGGAGGQNVNKVSSAVRITHLPTGIVVSCEIERSQLFNKETCMRMLREKLMARQIEEREAHLKSIIGEQKNIEWGSQIRSYVFCPYTLVKDNRTDYETSDVEGTMEGNLDPFMFAYLEMEVKKNGH